MNLFDPERPEITAGKKALLIDGSAVPHITVIPLNDRTLQISAMLRSPFANGSYIYCRYEKEIDFTEIELFFAFYNQDPEGALSVYFDWRATAPTSPVVKAKAKNDLMAQYIEDLI